jgi:hypothetical protein
VQTSKFIYQQIPAPEMLHYKVNSVSNEKRGRSDLYPVFGYLKRLRDSVNYSVIALQKQSAWAIDTKIEGNQDDIDNYVKSIEQQGAIAPAGSEFVHSAQVVREFLSANASSGGQSEAFLWCLSMISIGSGIPVSWLGSHLSSGSTRASAVVSTEPVHKKFEMRQKLYEQIILDLWDYLMTTFGIKATCEVTFPDLITQDRSQKLKDLALCQSQGYFSKERCANIAAKEFNATDFNFDTEIVEEETDPVLGAPLTQPPMLGTQGLTSPERKDIKDDDKPQ